MSNLNGLLYGAVGGGIATVILRITETYIIAPIMNKRLGSSQKLWFYAKPFWFDCYELQKQIHRILKEGLGHPDWPAGSLDASYPKEKSSISWFVNEGYSITSTAYLFASVAAWIVLFERDVVYLEFNKKTS